MSSVTVLLHGTTLDLGAPFNGGGQRLVSVLPWDRDCLGPRGFSATSDPMESELGEVWGIRIRPYISHTTLWLGTFIPRAACLGIWRILRRWRKEGIEFHLLFFYLDNNAWWEKKNK